LEAAELVSPKLALKLIDRKIDKLMIQPEDEAAFEGGAVDSWTSAHERIRRGRQRVEERLAGSSRPISR
jgi:hypothetical protein